MSFSPKKFSKVGSQKMTSEAVKLCCSTFIDHPAAHTFCFDSVHAGFTVLLTPVQVSEIAVGLYGQIDISC